MLCMKSQKYIKQAGQYFSLPVPLTWSSCAYCYGKEGFLLDSFSLHSDCDIGLKEGWTHDSLKSFLKHIWRCFRISGPPELFCRWRQKRNYFEETKCKKTLNVEKPCRLLNWRLSCYKDRYITLKCVVNDRSKVSWSVWGKVEKMKPTCCCLKYFWVSPCVFILFHIWNKTMF